MPLIVSRLVLFVFLVASFTAGFGVALNFFYELDMWVKVAVILLVLAVEVTPFWGLLGAGVVVERRVRRRRI